MVKGRNEHKTFQMPKIKIKTIIDAPINRVFDLARSIDLHTLSTKKTNEKAVAGKTSGLIELGESVTWRAKHLGVYQKLSVEIIEYDKPNMFKDVMLKGAFKSMSHKHSFKQIGNKTTMTDEFEFESPLGPIGKIANYLFLKNYMKQFLIKKNKELKKFAENEELYKLILK